jgi:AraC family transcriptional regulator, regulatory protein of adaptative response / methylated-DNA-[protein]-cysteine methyltransferase
VGDVLERAQTQVKGTINGADCWQAVMAHDARFDGEFVYAVETTGIYCRPSCTSRRPQRQNVRFFSLPEAAESEGFRPCKRCRPQTVTSRDPQVEMIRKACHFVFAHLDESPTLSDIGAHVGLSPYHLQRVFKRIMGISPRQYADACRLELLKSRLREGDSVTCALYDAGYSSSSRLYERSSDHLGMTPATYRRGGQGMEIEYTICESALGLLLVATTERGICAVHIGESEAELQAVLCTEYPAARITHNRVELCDWVIALLSHLDGWQPHLDLPMDVQATAFQWRVWQELREIPYGETRTYREIAEAIGQPNAVSAVAKAIADNRVALVIPCHRAECADGETTTFYSVRGDKARKKLKAHERQHLTEAVGD